MDTEPIKASVTWIAMVRFYSKFNDLVRLLDLLFENWEVLQARRIFVGREVVAA